MRQNDCKASAERTGRDKDTKGFADCAILEFNKLCLATGGEGFADGQLVDWIEVNGRSCMLKRIGACQRYDQGEIKNESRRGMKQELSPMTLETANRCEENEDMGKAT